MGKKAFGHQMSLDKVNLSNQAKLLNEQLASRSATRYADAPSQLKAQYGTQSENMKKYGVTGTI